MRRISVLGLLRATLGSEPGLGLGVRRFQSTSGANQGTAGVSGNVAAGSSAASHSAASAPITKLARIFVMELGKIKSEARINPDPAHRVRLEAQIAATPLTSISGLDGKVIVQILSALEVVEAQGSAKVVDDCVAWILERTADISVVLAAQMCASLCKIQSPRRVEVLDAMAPVISSALAAQVAHSTVLSLLCSYAAEAPHNTLIGTLIAKARQSIGETSPGDVAALVDSAHLVGRNNVDLAAFLQELVTTVVPGLVSSASYADMTKLLSACILFGDRSAAEGDAVSNMLGVLEKEKFEVSVESIAGIVTAFCAAWASRVPTSKPPTGDLGRRVVELLLSRVKDLPKLSHSEAATLLHAIGHAASVVVAPPVVEPDVVLAVLSHSSALTATSSQGRDEPRDVLAPETIAKALDGLALMCGCLRGPSQAAAKAAEAAFIERVVPLGVGTGSDSASSVFRSGFWVAARMRPSAMELRAEDLRGVVMQSCTAWSSAELMAVLRATSMIATPAGRKLLRDMAPKITDKVQVADCLLLSSVAAAYGRARVRHENLCNAINERALTLKEQLGAHELCVVLGALASVEHRNARCFLDLLPSVRVHLPHLSASQVTCLIVAYAAQSVWNYRLFSRLGDRAFTVADQLTVNEMVAIVTSLQRMDVRHPRLMGKLALRAKAVAETTASCSTTEAVSMLSAFSRSDVWDVQLFESLVGRVIADKESLDAALLGETLMSFARVDLKAHRVFQDLSLRALALAPTCPPLPLANIITAYAAANCRHVELFSVLGERALALKDECPAVTLSAVLLAFATVGIKNDRLFIELIPRMRHVTNYGGPQDVANVLVAYTKVGLWHYKLFVRLADRALQVRGDCRGPHIAKILGAFAKVDMRYEKLFVEMSSRVQAVAKHLTPADTAAIAHAYASARVFDNNVFRELGARAAASAALFEPQEIDTFMSACKRAGQLTDEIRKVFPQWDPETSNSASAAAAPTSDGTPKECEALPEAQL